MAARRAGERIHRAVADADTLRMMTLTLVAVHLPLRDQIDHLLASFRRLRQQRSWQHHVTGSIATIQITYNAETDRWHPHLHLLWSGVYYAHGLLRDQWSKASDGSTIVDIRPIDSRERSSSYVSRYIASPDEIEGWPPITIRDYARGLAGRRTIIATGIYHKATDRLKQTDPVERDSRPMIPLAVLGGCLAAGYAPAREATAYLMATSPAFVGFITQHTDGLTPMTLSQAQVVAPQIIKLLDGCQVWWDHRNDPPPPHRPPGRRIRAKDTPRLPHVTDHMRPDQVNR